LSGCWRQTESRLFAIVNQGTCLGNIGSVSTTGEELCQPGKSHFHLYIYVIKPYSGCCYVFSLEAGYIGRKESGKIMDSMEALSSKVDQIIQLVTEMEENKVQAISSIQNISDVSEQTAASSEEVTAYAQEQMAGIEDLAAKADEL
jgi:hypothetical protein